MTEVAAPPARTLASVDAMIAALAALNEKPQAQDKLPAGTAHVLTARGWAVGYRERPDAPLLAALTLAGHAAYREIAPRAHSAPGWEMDAEIARDVLGLTIDLHERPTGFSVRAYSGRDFLVIRAPAGCARAPAFNPSTVEIDALRCLDRVRQTHGYDRITSQMTADGLHAYVIHRGRQAFRGLPAATAAAGIASAILAFSGLNEAR
ncbi:hypothetical protein CKO28_13800 [Rhodovibrio sodomensis]|uniref:Uncharacterized protein n=1 Tax=Rhodovibrio sodomensis TaxID=1088 RepID=A0ABS1DHW9_9PROT|nr:hypothetical protein [Rhodovibrio sodomensis]MBK1669108.1 hypothetical protein [Rhodovibrio sodomensis]